MSPVSPVSPVSPISLAHLWVLFGVIVFGTLPLIRADLLQSVSQSAVMGRNFHQNMKMMEKGDEWCGLRRAPSVLRETTMVSKAPWELIASGIKFIFPTFWSKFTAFAFVGQIFSTPLRANRVP